MSIYKPYTSPTVGKATQKPVTEFDILRTSHRFLRDEASAPSSWNDQVARKYYDSLYREFALCNLKHYKSGNFALRWRTENEVLDGTGETTCANMRCKHHRITSSTSQLHLTTLELPFIYEEHEERKEALVKVVLCSKCVKKLLWTRTQGRRVPKDGKSKEDSVRDAAHDNNDRGEGELKSKREGDLGKKKRDWDSRSRSPPCSGRGGKEGPHHNHKKGRHDRD